MIRGFALNLIIMQGEMDVHWEGCTTAEEVLQRLKSVGINMKSVTSVLANNVLFADLLATCNGETLLHIAARARDVSVLLEVVQAYKKGSGRLAQALATANEAGALPIHIAVCHCNYENTVLLLKECKEHSPDSLTATMSGETLMHIAASMSDGVLIVKYLLREYREVCEPMLLTKNNRRATPLQVAEGTKQSAEFQLAGAESFVRNVNAQGKMPQFAQDSTREFHTRQPRQQLEYAKDIIFMLSEPTMQAKAAEAERETRHREEQKLQELEMKISEELSALLKDEKWEAIEEYVLSNCGDIQKLSLKFLASVVCSSEMPVDLPPLTAELLAATKKYLDVAEDDPLLKSSLELLAEFSRQRNSATVLMSAEGVLGLVLKHLRSLVTHLQHLSASILLHTATNTEDHSRIKDEWKQPLLLVKNFSVDQDVQRLAGETLERLEVSREVPDPGSWSTSDVCFWMNGNTGLERRSEFVKAFRDAEISGLHLLELAPTEMSGLGVKFVSDQRKLSSLIDDLRRLNMRSMVGRKDVFLSYAHINVEFALRVKRAMNDGGYSVWIDTAGIRAGQKWRTEIAHGIDDSRVFVFIMTPRSTNSQYCHDELSLAEEYKKPIVTVKYQHSEEMDPGLKLIVQRRQWMDFSDDSQFDSSCTKLLEAVCRLIGPGSGPDGEEEDVGHRHAVESSVADGDGAVPETEPPVMAGALSADDVREMVAREVASATAELKRTIRSLETRVAALENQQ